MPITRRSDLVIPEVLADTVAGAWPDKIALYGTNVVVESSSLPGGARGGDYVQVPYFGVIGEFEDIEEGAALTPAPLTMTTEKALVRRAGKAFEITTWARLAAFGDPYAEAARQIVEGARRKFDSALINAAAADGDGQTTLDVYPNVLDYYALVDALAAFGDEDVAEAVLVVHSSVITDLRKATDSVGRPLFLDPQAGGLPRVLGFRTIVSDRLPTTPGSGGNPPKRTSLLIRRGALALWYNRIPTVETDRDILTDTDVMAINVYYVAHRYSRLPGSSRPGVVRIFSA